MLEHVVTSLCLCVFVAYIAKRTYMSDLVKKNKTVLVAVFVFLLMTFGAEAQKTNKSQKPVKKTETKAPVKKPTTQKTKVQTPAKKNTSKTSTEVKKTTEASKTEKSVTATTSSDPAEDEKKVKDMITFFQFVLNTLGSSATTSRDKDVLITESYSKIFRDDKVQVEDDLDEERDVITYKDVVAYLKDVDFFFNDAKFEFTIEDIKSSTLPDGQLFYKVSLRRNLTGTTAEGQPVNNVMPRFIEINYNPNDQDLKIVSIYTKEFNEKEALTNWWNGLSYEWKSIFKQKLAGRSQSDNLRDSVSLAEIKNITTLEELDLRGNQYIQNIEPLMELTNLKLLDLSYTGITDLTPIRNLTELVELNLSHSKVEDLSPLKYANKLMRLNIAHTEVTDISVVEKMLQLQNFELSETRVTNFTPLANLTKLFHLNAKATQLANLSPLENLVQMVDLNLSRSLIQDLNPLKPLKNLMTLTIDSTIVKDLTPLSSLEKLKVLHANYTLVTELQPLQKLTHLEKIYCDHTPVTRDKADAFMAANPKVLVIFDSKDLMAWWSTLSPAWQNLLSKTAKVAAEPSKEELAKVTNLDSINFSSNRNIYDLEPLRKLQKLQMITAYNTHVKDLSPLKDHKEVRYLDISDTEVNDLSHVSQFTKLKVLKADKTKIETIEPLYTILTLEKLYVDQTAVVDINVREFLDKNTRCLVIYKTNHLNRWWRSLSIGWKEVFYTHVDKDTAATRENLHRLAEREVLHFKDAAVNDLSALNEFVRLKELHFSGTPINTIPALDNIKSLKSLHAVSSPIQKIESLSQFVDLEDLDISNTPVDELKPISNLQGLKKLNCAGTQIRKLDPLEKLEKLEFLDCSNTKASSLDPVIHLPLKTLKCYNAKVSARDVEKFKERNPDCNVVYYR